KFLQSMVIQSNALLTGHVLRQFGRAHRVPGLTCVVECLIRRDLGEVVEEIGSIKRPDLEGFPRRSGLRLVATSGLAPHPGATTNPAFAAFSSLLLVLRMQLVS